MEQSAEQERGQPMTSKTKANCESAGNSGNSSATDPQVQIRTPVLRRVSAMICCCGDMCKKSSGKDGTPNARTPNSKHSGAGHPSSSAPTSEEEYTYVEHPSIQIGDKGLTKRNLLLLFPPEGLYLTLEEHFARSLLLNDLSFDELLTARTYIQKYGYGLDVAGMIAEQKTITAETGSTKAIVTSENEFTPH